MWAGCVFASRARAALVKATAVLGAVVASKARTVARKLSVRGQPVGISGL